MPNKKQKSKATAMSHEEESVCDYFERVLDADPTFLEIITKGSSRGSLEDMPLESTCGDECKKVIDAARGLLDFVERATAKDYPERNRAVQQVAMHCCLTFING